MVQIVLVAAALALSNDARGDECTKACCTPLAGGRTALERTATGVRLLRDGRTLWNFEINTPEGRPFFHPLALPDGRTLTDIRPKDHIWHLGYWFSWKYINGVNYWEPADAKRQGTEPAGRTRVTSQRMRLNGLACTIDLELDYGARTGDTGTVLAEARTVTVSAPDPSGGYAITTRHRFTALADVTLDRTPPHGSIVRGKWGGGYAGPTLRLDERIAQTWRVRGKSGGETPADVTAKETERIDCSDPETKAGFSFERLWAPSTSKFYLWPDKRMINASVVYDAALSLKKGETLELAYRLTVRGADGKTGGERAFMKRADYLDLAEAAVAAYSDEHIRKFVAETARDGVQNHGFPRLTANVGLLIANGRLAEKRDVFGQMMDISCRDAAKGKMPFKAGGNEFSVKELVFALVALEKAGVYPKERTDAWRATLSKVDAWRCYQKIHEPDMSWSGNWPIFGCASEQARLKFGLGGDRSFIDMYATDYLRWFDENGMFKDPFQPTVYDFVTRMQFMHVLEAGYDGPVAARIAKALDRSAEVTLWMLSAAGEIPYGGRSNQFLHNNTMYAAVCEWYAARFAKAGNREMAHRFKRAASRAADALAPWLAHRPLNHVKNLYLRDENASSYDALPAMGCEKYAFFDKYMVTMASWAMSAWRFCDDSIVSQGEVLAEPPVAFATSPEFHWVFLSAGDYSAQFDWQPNDEYDALGLGRVQRRGAPAAICLSTPCAKSPHYRRETENGAALAILPVVPEGTPLKLFQRFASPNRAHTRWFIGDFEWNCTLTADGLFAEVKRPGKTTPPGPVALALPAFEFDGETETKIACDGRSLVVSYKGWVCRYSTEDGTIVRTDVVTSNRNGRYRRYEVRGEKRIMVRVTIESVRGTTAPSETLVMRSPSRRRIRQ